VGLSPRSIRRSAAKVFAKATEPAAVVSFTRCRPSGARPAGTKRNSPAGRTVGASTAFIVGSVVVRSSTCT
jgi:hypothetical protein